MIRIESEIISRENVGPSFPTPENLKTYKLSMLDQISPSMLVPIVLYFPNSGEVNGLDFFISQTTEKLRHSLSLILSRFYPFAGRISKDCRSVNCNDEGVPFVVARLGGATLAEVLKNPDHNLLRKLLPCDFNWTIEEGPDSTVALVQVNYFECGGIAIGAVFCHSIADALTIGNFLTAWAAVARGSAEAICPNFISQSLFPHKEEIAKQTVSQAAILKTGNSVMRRFVFTAATVSELKSKSGVARASRVEVVSALLWKCFMSISAANDKTTSFLTHAVNIRRRAVPPFPVDCFGNWPGLAVAWISNEPDTSDLGILITKMRESISKIDDDFVNRLRGEGGVAGYYENMRRTWSEIPAGADNLAISSWCGFGFYDIDFGWGKPVWLSRFDNGDSNSHFLNTVWLMDSRDGGGVEAWVILDEKYMQVFEQADELRALAAVDPSPLED